VINKTLVRSVKKFLTEAFQRARKNLISLHGPNYEATIDDSYDIVIRKYFEGIENHT